MRAISTDNAKIFTLSKRQVFLRIDIDTVGNGTYTRMDTLDGMDWCHSAEWGNTVDAPAQTATVRLFRNVFNRSLATYVTGSKYNSGQPAIASGRGIRIYTAMAPIDVPRAAVSTWNLMFDGYIDETEMARSPIELHCRDLGAIVIDSQIENQTAYGSPTGDAINVVMQSIITDAINTLQGLSLTLYVVGSPTFAIKSYLQQKESVMDALRKLSDLIGWTVRYKWDDASSSFKLTLYVPPRSSVTSLFTFGPGDYYDVATFKESRLNVRNRFRGVYTDSATGIRQSLLLDDSVSRGKYGYRFMEITEAATSQINTSAQMTTMLQAAQSDLSLPYAEKAMTVDYFYPAELGDLYTFQANGIHYDADQLFAVVEYKHNITAERCTTELTVRGKPLGSYRRWLQMDGRNGVAPNADLVGPVVANVITSVGVGSIAITYDDPGDDWSTTEVYVSTSSGNVASPGTYADPGSNVARQKRPSSSYLAANGKKTRFDLVLAPATTYYVSLIAVDHAGNPGAITVLAGGLTTQAVGPYHTNNDSTVYGLVQNQDLCIYTLQTAMPVSGGGRPAPPKPPDFWFANVVQTGFETDLSNGAWLGTTPDNLTTRGVYCSYNAAAGKFCIEMRSHDAGGGIVNNSAALMSDYVPFAAGDIVSASFVGKYTSAPVDEALDNVSIMWFDVNKALISTASYYALSSGIDTTSFKLGAQYSAYSPAGTRFFRVSLRARNMSANNSLYVDRVGVVRGLPNLSAAVDTGPGSPGSPGNQFAVNTDTVMWVGIASAAANVAFDWDGTNHQFVANIGGKYVFSAGCMFLETGGGAGAGHSHTLIIQQYTGGAWVSIARNKANSTTDFYATPQAVSQVVDVLPGDFFRLVYNSRDSTSECSPGLGTVDVSFFNGVCQSRCDR